MNQDKTQFRSLPRSSEVSPVASPSGHKPLRVIALVGAISLTAIVAMFILPTPHQKTKSNPARSKAAQAASIRPSGVIEQASTVAQPSKIEAYEQDALLKQQMMMRKSELENMQFRRNLSNNTDAEDYLTLPDAEKSAGVQLDSENLAERVYEDLNDRTTADSELPLDRINAGLVNRKWMNELERRQRILFVTNFIRSAREQGLEVQIDQNLVVVGVRRINATVKVDINKVMDRLARQGQ